jgi:hypothetical protein
MERTVTARELNRALLARQGLLERSERSIPEALDAMGALQAQYAPSMYIGLWSRLAGFERDALTRALEERVVVQATLLRSTIHLVSRADYWPLAVAIRDARRSWWQRVTKRDELSQEAETLRAALRDGPLKRKAIEELLGKEAFHGIGMWVDMVRVPPSGTWEHRRADLYGLAEDWIAPVKITPAQAIERLVRSYLRGFGPTSRADVASFTGFKLTDLAPVLKRVAPVRYRSAGGDELLDLPDTPLPDPDTPAPVRFLGTWDASLLVHARRTGVLPEEHRPRIFHTKAPQSFPTFLVDGAVAGTWRYEQGAIDLTPFGRLDARTRRELAAEAERLAAFHA